MFLTIMHDLRHEEDLILFLGVGEILSFIEYIDKLDAVADSVCIQYRRLLCVPDAQLCVCKWCSTLDGLLSMLNLSEARTCLYDPR